MPDDIWQVPEDTPAQARRRSPAVRVGRALVVAAAFATVGFGGVASASTGADHTSVTPVRVSVQNASVDTVVQHDCPFHSQSSTAGAQG